MLTALPTVFELGKRGKRKLPVRFLYALEALRRLSRLEYLFDFNHQPTSLKKKVYLVVADSYRKIGKAELENTLYSSSRSSIEKALGELVKEGWIAMVGSGKCAGYVMSSDRKNRIAFRRRTHLLNKIPKTSLNGNRLFLG